MTQPFVLAALLALPALASAQLPEIRRVAVEGDWTYTTLDLDTGELTVLEGEHRSTAPCYDNTVDHDLADALLFPAGDELFDWGIKTCGGSTFVDRITIGYGSIAIPTAQGGPGAALTLRIYEGGRGFGFAGTELLELNLSGLFNLDQGFPSVWPVELTIDLGSQAFFLPDGPIAWSYENPDGVTAPLLRDVTIENGTQNYFDLYRPGPARDGNYHGTYTLPPGGASNDPFENTFHIQLWQNETSANVATLGAGANPDVLSAPAPIVGRDWTASFDLTGFPSVFATTLAFTTQRTTQVPTRWGNLILDLDTRIGPALTQVNPDYTLVLPSDAALIGIQFFAQGGLFSAGAFELTNGLDLSIGTN